MEVLLNSVRFFGVGCGGGLWLGGSHTKFAYGALWFLLKPPSMIPAVDTKSTQKSHLYRHRSYRQETVISYCLWKAPHTGLVLIENATFLSFHWNAWTCIFTTILKKFLVICKYNLLNTTLIFTNITTFGAFWGVQTHLCVFLILYLSKQ